MIVMSLWSIWINFPTGLHGTCGTAWASVQRGEFFLYGMMQLIDFVCVYVCVFVYAFVCVCTHAHVRACMRAHMLVSAHMFQNLFILYAGENQSFWIFQGVELLSWTISLRTKLKLEY